jgi:subtilisin family serine protease
LLIASPLFKGRRKMATPIDPLFTSQWHFNLIGNIQAIWDDYDGAGVYVGVYDEGVDYTHEDLAANYESSLHVVDDSGEAVDPIPIGDAAHGTACAENLTSTAGRRDLAPRMASFR